MTSVIVTVFEQLRTLEVLLECLEAQECPFKWEVLVTDDGSASDTLELVRRFAKRGTLDLRFVWQEDRGFRVAAARNNAIRLAKGDVLVFLDAGMIVGADFVAWHTSFHKQKGLLVCGTRTFTLVGEHDDLVDLYRKDKLNLIRTPESDRQLLAAQTSTPWVALLGCNFSVRRSLEVQFDEGFVGWGYEDREFAYRLAHDYGYTVIVSSEIDAIHVSPKRGADEWQPLRCPNGSEQAIVSLLRNMLYFADLHPSAELEPALKLLQTFHLDPDNDRWFRNTKMPSSGTTLESVREWFVRNGIDLATIETSTAHR
jgi:glycosyltransferase involved in cell wall biosynthesis